MSIAPEASIAKRHLAGTHRVIAPAETLARIERFFPVMGITRVADITGIDTLGIPVVLVYRPNSRSVVTAQGKGLDLMAAKASGVMESVEVFTAERIIKPLLLASFNDLRFSYPLVNVELLPRSTNSPYHPDFPILWIEGRELFTDGPVWIPYETVHTAHTLPLPSGTGCFLGTTTGLASGNHYLEAVSHGLCEVVERDAATLYHVLTETEKASRRVDPRSVDDPSCLAVLRRVEQANMSVGIWDITTDVGLPVFKCIIAERDHDAPRVMYGAEGLGCHPARGIALLRAITEAAQARLAIISCARDNVPPGDYDLVMDPESGRKQAAVLAGEAHRDFRATPSFDGDTFDADVAWELDALRSVGISEVAVVDLTREEFGIPVVRVVVPGLEGPVELVPSCRLGQRAIDLAGRR